MDDDPAAVEPFKGVAGDDVAGAAVGFAFGGPAGAAAWALTPLAARLGRLSSAEIRGGQERAAAAWAIASEQSGEDIDALLRRARADPDRLHLGYSAGEAAARARYPARVVALGRALAAGLLADDDTVLDDEQQMVDALAEIERPHLVLLTRLMTV